MYWKYLVWLSLLYQNVKIYISTYSVHICILKNIAPFRERTKAATC